MIAGSPSNAGDTVLVGALNYSSWIRGLFSDGQTFAPLMVALDGVRQLVARPSRGGPTGWPPSGFPVGIAAMATLLPITNS